jgi:hypothetical protein
MKGFPNQVANLSKLATGMRALTDSLTPARTRDDGVFGERWCVRVCAEPGTLPIDVRANYIQQAANEAAEQSELPHYARGLRGCTPPRLHPRHSGVSRWS